MTLPVALSGTDVIGQAKTGTGKTLGFGLPLLERVTVPADVEAGRARPEDLTEAPQALVVVPTRELCTQVTNDLLTAGKVRNVRVLAIYGGRAYEPQVEALKKGVDVIVGTPGRLLDLAGQKKLNLKHIKALVLDEADEMLDLGFLPDVEKIIDMLPARRQTMLFSATMPGAVIGLARRYMSRPTHIRATAPDDEGVTVANISQHVYRAHNMDKPEMVARILQADGRGLAMIFCRTKRTAADLADQLKQRGFASGAVHGDLGQGAREQALRAFRNGKVDVLVCTDVAARGIDVEGVTHVINYQSPEDEKTYLHRVGRTGRAGAKGIAITLVDWDDIPRWQLINKALELNFNDPPETYSSSPHFYEEMNIPAGTKGVLPRTERTRAGLDAEELEDLGETGGRGGRGRGDRGGRGGRDESRSGDRERPARTPRRRRRTRNGAPLDDTAAPAGTVAPEETAVTEDSPASRTPRRRRRTRNGAPAVESVPATTTTSEAAETAVDTAEAVEAKPRRRRTRRSAEAAAVETPVAVEAPQVVAEAAEPEAPAAEATVTRPRRRTRKAAETVAVEAPAVVEVAEAEAPAAAPRRRTRKTAAAAETAVDTAEGTETKPRRTRKAAAVPEATVEAVEATETKPRRTRKAAASAEAAVDTAEATEAKPRTRRTRKVAEPAAAVVEIPAQTAEEPETKPRRTRKATAAAETAVDTAEGTETKPRRTRKAAVATETAEAKPARKTAARKTAAAAEAAVDTVEATETKPRRTRKATTAAETAVDTAEATEAKPRRTRKAAVAATEPEAAEAPAAPRRRTRKTAAAAETAVDTAEGTETKPRRTRKAAVATETAEAKPARKTTARKTAAATDIPAQAAEEPEAKPRRRTRKATAAAESTES
ncbi:DEAD/DEAH box helicase [Streptomyces sp. S.PB5]|uniref:DEAD/DEAH box helicase n=1 Tax=Streptomyces sp. S.PB5 TaxID=3020844 RepID=UPI0025AF723E|nr:DEAD/DEAH box helicase [Streptomyces sp. S.PB5]MDN3026589.1 DEAD/DEAH box helicase [Streptomyces sp. S.PB5]